MGCHGEGSSVSCHLCRTFSPLYLLHFFQLENSNTSNLLGLPLCKTYVSCCQLASVLCPSDNLENVTWLFSHFIGKKTVSFNLWTLETLENSGGWTLSPLVSSSFHQPLLLAVGAVYEGHG
jgi:hypothetical protein